MRYGLQLLDMLVRRSIKILLQREHLPTTHVCRPSSLLMSLLPSYSSQEELSKPATPMFIILLSGDLDIFQRGRVRSKVSTTEPG